MRHIVAVTLGLLLLGAALHPAVLAQATEASGRKIVSRVTPVYPELARKMNVEGSVKLLVTVAPNGIAKNVEAVGGSPLLVKAAEDAMYKFRWAPAAQESKELMEIRFHR